MDIADNIIRNKLKNVYFIWGRGKTTVADILKSKYGCFVFGTDEARDRNMAYDCPENQPYMCRDFVKEYGVNSFWELPKEVISGREHRFYRVRTKAVETFLGGFCKYLLLMNQYQDCSVPNFPSSISEMPASSIITP